MQNSIVHDHSMWSLHDYRRLATPPRKGVRLMWNEKIAQVLRIALCLLWVLYILTTKAC